jgi:hypothetical protein
MINLKAAEVINTQIDVIFMRQNGPQGLFMTEKIETEF